MPWEQKESNKTDKNTVSQHSVKCIIRIKKLKMPSFCISKRITEAVKLYTVHEKCSSSFCLSGEAVLSLWLLLGASHSALRFLCRRCCWRKKCKEIIYADDILNCCLTAVLVQKCYFNIGNSIVEMFKLLSSVFRGLCGLWKLLLHEWGEKKHSIAGEAFV